MALRFHALWQTMAVGLLTLLTCTSAAFALEPGEMFDDPKLEQRARDIGRNLRCVVCQNQSIFDSNAGLAKDLRGVVRERIRAGDSDQQVIDHVAARYGDFVLMQPPVDTHTIILWLAPVLIVLGGLVTVALYLRGRRANPEQVVLSEADRAAARQLLGGDKS